MSGAADPERVAAEPADRRLDVEARRAGRLSVFPQAMTDVPLEVRRALPAERVRALPHRVDLVELMAVEHVRGVLVGPLPAAESVLRMHVDRAVDRHRRDGNGEAEAGRDRALPRAPAGLPADDPAAL